MFIVAQIFGILSLISYLISTQIDNRKKFFFWFSGTAIFSAIQYFLLGGLSGFAANIIPIFRNAVYSKYKKAPSFWVGFFCVAVILAGIFFYSGPISLLPIAETIIYTIYLSESNLTHFRLIQIFSSTFMIAYNIIIGAYTALFIIAAQVLFVFIGTIRFDSKKFKKLFATTFKRKK